MSENNKTKKNSLPESLSQPTQHAHTCQETGDYCVNEDGNSVSMPHF